MKTLLVALNAKYIHTNLALLSLCGYAKSVEPPNISGEIAILECTINQQYDVILREIYKQKPDIIGFSCYIWNIEQLKELVPTIKLLLPKAVVFVGGPEVSFLPQEALKMLSCDLILIGEGEKSFCSLLEECNRAKSKGETTICCENISGCCYHDIAGAKCTAPPSPLRLDDIPFCYENLSDYTNRILYYESSRGCPFNCQYCLSGDNNSVRFRSLDMVKNDMKRFLAENVRQVKFVDRTFNCDKKRALSLWQFLSENDNGVTNFHFEIAAELITQEQIDFLKTVRTGLFQFEIGVQSTNEPTLTAIKRITLPNKLTPIITSIQESENIHLHLDLIAGLPHEGISEFRESFNYVYSLLPNQFQLGFLKLLKGSGLFDSAKNFGIVCSKKAPYEVLFTKKLSYDEVLTLKMVEGVLDKYYNSGRFSKTLSYAVSLFKTPFDCYKSFGDFFEQNNYHLALHNKNEDYEILFNFLSAIENSDIERIKWLILYDCYANEKQRHPPAFLDNSTFLKNRQKIAAFFENPKNSGQFSDYSEFDATQLMRVLHIEIFPFNPQTNANEKTVLLFTYRGKGVQNITSCFE